MNRKRAIDLAIMLVSISLLLIALAYPQHIRQRVPLICLSGILAVIFLIMAIMDSSSNIEKTAAFGAGESRRDALAT